MDGDQAFLYFECHDADITTGALVSHLFLAGAVCNRGGRWVLERHRLLCSVASSCLEMGPSWDPTPAQRTM